MKKTLFLILLPFISAFGQTQNEYSLNLYVGKSISTFGFVNSTGVKTENTAFKNGDTYSADFEIQIAEKHLLMPGLMFHQAGAISDDGVGDMEWELDYLGIQYGYGYNILNKERFSMAPTLFLGADYLVKGIQTVGTTRYDVKAIDAFKDWNFRTNIGLNSRLRVAEYMSLVLDYRFNISLNQIEKKDADINQKTRNLGHLISLGLNINF